MSSPTANKTKELAAREEAVIKREQAVAEREANVKAVEEAMGLEAKKQAAGEPTAMSGEEGLKQLYKQGGKAEDEHKKRQSA